MKRYIKNLFSTVAILLLALVWQNDANAQCEDWEAYPQGVKEGRTQHVIYRDRFKMNKFEEAYPIWEELFKTVKIPVPNNSLHFTDGGQMSLYFAKKEQDATKKKEWVDKALALYDQNAKCNGDDAITRAYQAYYMYDAQVDVQKTYEIYYKSLELDKADKPTPAMILQPMAYLAYYLYTSKVEGFNADYMRELYERLKKFCEDKIAKKIDPAGYQKGWEEVDKYFEPIKEEIFGCDYWVAIYKPAFENLQKEKSSKELADTLYAVAVKLASKCGKEHELYTAVWAHYRKVKTDVQWEIMQNMLTSDTTTAYTKYALYEEISDLDPDNAEDYKEKQWELYPDIINGAKEWTDNELRANFAYRYADRLYRQGNFSGARTYCRAASKYKPNWGKPYMMVGTMYASSGPRCSANGTGFDAQVCVWAAMDEWYKAKSVDPSVAGDANAMIGKYSEYLPTKVELAQRGIAEGSPYTVGCWIQQGTTARGK